MTTKDYKPYGVSANKKVTQAGESDAKDAKNSLEKKLGKSVVISNSKLNYQHVNENLLKDENQRLKITCFLLKNLFLIV